LRRPFRAPSALWGAHHVAIAGGGLALLAAPAKHPLNHSTWAMT